MKWTRVTARTLAASVVSFTVLLFTACDSTKDVQIWVDGPWAIVNGPAGTRYQGRLLLIAPEAAPSLHATPAVPLVDRFQDLTSDSRLEINNVLPPRSTANPPAAKFPTGVFITKDELKNFLSG